MKLTPGLNLSWRRKRSCRHFDCRLTAWYAHRVWPFKGSGEQVRYKTAYIYPDSCYRETQPKKTQ